MGRRGPLRRAPRRYPREVSTLADATARAGRGRAGSVGLPGKGGPYERGVAPDIAGRSFRLEAEVDVRDGGTPDGVLYAVGGVHGGYWWYLHDGELAFEVAQSSVTTQTIAVPATLSSGRHRLAVELAAHEDLSGDLAFWLDGRRLGQGRVEGLLRRIPIGCGRTYVGAAPAGTVAGVLARPAELMVDLVELTVTTGSELAAVADAEFAAELRDQ